MEILSILLSLILLILALIHFYWASGGRVGFDAAVPTDEEGIKVITPGTWSCILVGIGRALFGSFYLMLSGIINLRIPENISMVMRWFIPIIFLLRAIGDFKYVGFSKKIKPTDFGKLDSMVYSPLCMVISILGLLIIYF